MNSHSARAPLAQRSVNIRLRRLRQIEGAAAIRKDYLHRAVAFYPHPHPRGIRYALASPVPDRVHEQLLQHQVQLKLHIGRERILAAKALDLAGQPSQFVNVAG
jgi:hypothetical protein